MTKEITSEENNLDNLLGNILQKYADKPLDLLLSNAIIRKNIIKFVDKKIKVPLLKIKIIPKESRKINIIW